VGGVGGSVPNSLPLNRLFSQHSLSRSFWSGGSVPNSLPLNRLFSQHSLSRMLWSGEKNPRPLTPKGGVLLGQKGGAKKQPSKGLGRIGPTGKGDGPKVFFHKSPPDCGKVEKSERKRRFVRRKVSYNTCIFVYGLVKAKASTRSNSRGAGVGDTPQYFVRLGAVGKTSALSAGRRPHILRK
jgi:hypothetical protein